MGILVAQTHPSVSAFPESTVGSACTSSFSRIARRSLTLRPAHSRGHQIVTVIRRLQTFRLLHACSGRFRLERSPGGACTHWKSAALSRRTWSSGPSRGLAAIGGWRGTLRGPSPAARHGFIWLPSSFWHAALRDLGYKL